MSNLGLPTQCGPFARAILAEVAEDTGVSVDELRGPCLKRRVTRARQEAMFRLYSTGRYSSVHVGRILGGRVHGTVLKGIRSREERLA